MTASTLTLADFLEARWAELEAKARGAAPGPWERRGMTVWQVGSGYPDDEPVLVARDEDGRSDDDADAVFAAAFDPAYVLADIESKRRILALHTPEPWDGSANAETVPEGVPSCSTCGNGRWDAVAWPCATVKALALPFAGHPDMRPEWLV